MHDDAVAADSELIADGGHALSGAVAVAANQSSGRSVAMCSSCSVVADQSMPPECRTTASARNRVSTPRSHCWSEQEFAVALEVGGKAAHSFHEPPVFGDVVADGGETGPHLDLAGSRRAFAAASLTVGTQRRWSRQ